jgi:aspartate/methionine/tyrosine aminotransferase
MERSALLEDVIHLEVGEPSFQTPQFIIDAACQAASTGFTRYTPNHGLAALREAVASRYGERWGADIDPSRVLISSGGVNAIAVTTYTIIEPGDEVLVPDPGWPNYTSIILLGGGVPVAYPLPATGGYLPSIEEIERRITKRTKILILNTPSNPTGAVFPAERIEALMDLASRHDLYVISDEIYEELVFDGEHVSAARFDRDGRVIMVSGFSKTYAMTGWRLGYAIGPREVIDVAGKLMESLVSCASSVSQMAGLAALTGPQDEVDAMRAAYGRRRDLVSEILEPQGFLPVVPQGAFYALVDLSATGMSGRDAAMRLLEEQRVAVAPGPTFGEVASQSVRLSLASSDEDVDAGCRRIIEFVSAHGQ